MVSETAALPVSLMDVVCPGGQYQCQEGRLAAEQRAVNGDAVHILR